MKTKNKYGIDLFSTVELLDLAKKLNVPVSQIKADSHEEDYIEVNGKFYKIFRNENLKDEALSWFEGIGSAEYFLKEVLKKEDSVKVINFIGSDIILNKKLFMTDTLNSMNDSYYRYLNENINHICSERDFYEEEFGLNLEDLLDFQKLWDSEIIFTGSSLNIPEMFLNIKRYDINEIAIYKEINKSYMSNSSILGDYGDDENYRLDTITAFRRDI